MYTGPGSGPRLRMSYVSALQRPYPRQTYKLLLCRVAPRSSQPVLRFPAGPTHRWVVPPLKQTVLRFPAGPTYRRVVPPLTLSGAAAPRTIKSNACVGLTAASISRASAPLQARQNPVGQRIQPCTAVSGRGPSSDAPTLRPSAPVAGPTYQRVHPPAPTISSLQRTGPCTPGADCSSSGIQVAARS